MSCGGGEPSRGSRSLDSAPPISAPTLNHRTRGTPSGPMTPRCDSSARQEDDIAQGWHHLAIEWSEPTGPRSCRRSAPAPTSHRGRDRRAQRQERPGGVAHHRHDGEQTVPTRRRSARAHAWLPLIVSHRLAPAHWWVRRKSAHSSGSAASTQSSALRMTAFASVQASQSERATVRVIACGDDVDLAAAGQERHVVDGVTVHSARA